MRGKQKTPFNVYEALRSTGEQQTRLYGLANVHKKETPPRPVRSIRGSCYHNLNEFLTPFFQKIERANIKTNTNNARHSGANKTCRRTNPIIRCKKFIHQRSRKGNH